MNPVKYLIASLLLIASFSVSADASVPHEFSNGSVADADEMNANFAALVATIEALQARVDALEVANGSGSGLNDVLTVTTDNNGYPAVIVTGANFQVRSAAEGEAAIPGVGNIIIGNNLANDDSFPRCSNPDLLDKSACQSAGFNWSESHKIGYENLIVGHGHSYASHGSLVAGSNNTVLGQYSSVSGGYGSIASGDYSSISGGRGNTALGDYSSVSGGRGNSAQAENSTVSGGRTNRATGIASSISGGFNNEASGERSSVNGGRENKSTGRFSSVSGGRFSFAIGDTSHISGGNLNRANAEYSVVGGGESQTADTASSWVGGAIADSGTGTTPTTENLTPGQLPNSNSAIGEDALAQGNQLTGGSNAALGKNALKETTSGFDNVGIGKDALFKQKTGSKNIGIGYKAGSLLESGSNNIYIGNPGDVAESNMIVIGCIGGEYGNPDNPSQAQSCDEHIKTKVETKYFETRGNVSAKTVTIRGGADIAEPFAINNNASVESAIKAGMIVSIDTNEPGSLTLSNRAYDRNVAGIISGAGGINAGLTLTQEGTLAAGEYPVALTGRVYAWVDADVGGEVKPGDLLTTSSTLGHAMKATNSNQVIGTTLGKAMTPLKSGRGLVLVLLASQ